MIPEAKQPSVGRALQAAFGTTEIEDIRALPGGLSSALVYRIVVKGHPYLLRVGGFPGADPAVEHTCMHLGAAAGLAPRIWHQSEEDWLLISDYVEPHAFPEDAATRLAATIRRLHAVKGFPLPNFGSYFDSMAAFVQRFEAAKLLPEGVTEALLRHYREALAVYPKDPGQWVASHNELKPLNMLFDGQQFKFIDWESAFLNDPYVDLAVAGYYYVDDDADERAFLAAYFGEPASEYQRARFYLMRHIIHVNYVAVLLLIAARAGAAIDVAREVPNFEAFHHGLATGAISIESADAKVQYALVHLNQALAHMRSPRFREAVALVDVATRTSG